MKQVQGEGIKKKKKKSGLQPILRQRSNLNKAKVQPKQSKVTHKLGTMDLETQLFHDIEETLIVMLFNDVISNFLLEVEMRVLQQLK